MTRRSRFLTAVAAVIFIALVWHGYEANKGFTPWLSGSELGKVLAPLDAHDPGQPNFWDQGHWVGAVEGRWHNGIPEYRFRIEDAPKDYHYSWYWYFNQDQQAFASHVHEFADQGFTLIDPNSFRRPDDTRRYQGVWHRLDRKRSEDVPPPVVQPPPAPVNPTPAIPSAPVALPVSPPASLATGPNKNLNLRNVLDQATQAVLTLKNPKDFDAVINSVDVALEQARTGNFGDGTDRQSAYMQLEGASRFLKQWQSYLIDEADGNTQSASNDLRNLTMGSTSSFMPIPRSELLERAMKETALPPKEMEAKITLNSLEDLQGAINQIEAMQRTGNYNLEMNSLMNAMQNLQSAYEAFKEKNYAAVLQQLVMNQGFMISRGLMSASGDQRNDNADSLHKKLADLKNGLVIDAVQGMLARPDAVQPRRDESAQDYLQRLASSEVKAGDWQGLQQVLRVYQQASPFNSTPWLAEDMAGLRAYLVGNKLEAAGQHLDAIRSYRQSLATVGKFFPAAPAANALDDLQKKYPDLYREALQTPITPASPQGP